MAEPQRRFTSRQQAGNLLKPLILMAKQVFDCRPGKGFTTAQSNEHQRRWTEKAWSFALSKGNYDRTREHLNFEIRKGSKIQAIDKSQSIPERMKENLVARGIKDLNEGREKPYYRTIVNIILGGSRDRMREIAFGDQQVDYNIGADNSDVVRTKDIEQWAKDMYKFVADKYGEDNIVGFYVHLDETNPHCHCTLLPLDENQKFAYKRMFAGSDKFEYSRITSEHHDELAKVNAKWGLDRGDRIAETGARHRSTEEYRRQLTHECSALEKDIESNKAKLHALYMEIHLAERRVKGLTTMIANLEEKKATIESEQKRLADELANGRGNADAIRDRIKKLDIQLQSVITSLADKNTKLDVAVQQRDKIAEDIQEMRTQRDEIKKQLYGVADQMEEQIRYRLKDAVMSDVVSHFQEALPQMTFRDLDVFDGSLLADMATRGEEILTCAMYLYGGMMDDATTFAEGHGGGGGCSDLPWGRKEDEDDRAWAMRCMRMAHRMMKPSGSRRMRR